MTKDQLKSAVIEATGRRDKSNLILTGIDLALVDISQMHDFKAMRAEVELAIVDEQESVPLPTDLVQIVEVRFIDGLNAYPIGIAGKKNLLAIYPNVEEQSTGRPSYAYEEGGSLFLVPRSNGDYTIRLSYYRYNEITELTDSPQTKWLDHAIIAWTTAYIFQSTQQYEDAREWTGRYELAIRKAIRADNRRNRDWVLQPFGSNTTRSYGPVIPPHLDPFAKRDL